MEDGNTLLAIDSKHYLINKNLFSLYISSLFCFVIVLQRQLFYKIPLSLHIDRFERIVKHRMTMYRIQKNNLQEIKNTILSSRKIVCAHILYIVRWQQASCL